MMKYTGFNNMVSKLTVIGHIITVCEFVLCCILTCKDVNLWRFIIWVKQWYKYTTIYRSKFATIYSLRRRINPGFTHWCSTHNTLGVFIIPRLMLDIFTYTGKTHLVRTVEWKRPTFCNRVWFEAYRAVFLFPYISRFGGTRWCNGNKWFTYTQLSDFIYNWRSPVKWTNNLICEPGYFPTGIHSFDRVSMFYR